MQRVFYQAARGLDIPGCTSCPIPRVKVLVIAANRNPGGNRFRLCANNRE